MTAGTVPVSALAFIDALQAMAQDPGRWVDAIDAIEQLRPIADDDPARPLLDSFASRAITLADGLRALATPAQSGHGRFRSGLLLSPDGVVRSIAGNACERLKPFVHAPPSAFQALRFLRQWSDAFSSAIQVALSGRHGGYAHLRLDGGEGQSVFVVLMDRRVFPEQVFRMFGLNEGGLEPMLAFVIMGESEGRPQEAHDGQIFGLTPAEWRLALELRKGVSVSDAAFALGISVNTARTQVKSIFSKLGVARQSELVRRLEGYEVLQPQLPALGSTEAAVARKFATAPDGRRLAFREYGDPRGQPVLFFHQWFASSLLPVAARHALALRKLRLVAIDRPGFGQSQMSGTYAFDTVARDAIAVADMLGAEKFSIMAVAPGAPFAVEVARLAPTRVSKLALLAPRLFPVQQDNQHRGRLARGIAGLLRHPWAISPLVRMMRTSAGERLTATMLRHIGSGSERDRLALADPETCRSVVQMGCDAHESSAEGFIAELELFAKGQFPDPALVSCDIAVWHGEEDPLALLDHTLSVFGSDARVRINVLPRVGAIFDADAYGRVLDWLSH